MRLSCIWLSANDRAVKTRASRTPDRRFARRSFWLGSLCLLAQFAVTLHMVIVAHVRCEEHGNWTHADVHAVDARDQASDVASANGLEGFDEHAHDHCLLITEQCRALPLATGDAAAYGQREGPVELLGAASARRDRAVCSYAPKTSPPGQVAFS
jgi:hypothetical protein